MALRWFKRNRPPEIWDERIDGPIGDLEAAHRIRDICRAADAVVVSVDYRMAPEYRYPTAVHDSYAATK